MKKLLATAFLAALASQTFAQTLPAPMPEQEQTHAALPCTAGQGTHSDTSQSQDTHQGSASLMPCNGATAAMAAASGSLTPIYIGAGVAATGVVAAAINGGGSGHGNDQGAGGTTGTTGTK